MRNSYWLLTVSPGIVMLWPQFTIHQEAIGLTKYQTGIIGTVMSAVTIVVPLLAGVIGDKLGDYKVKVKVSVNVVNRVQSIELF